MEVTRKNFKEALPLVQSSIKAADFLTIDTEFTGLINGRDVSIFDSPQEYYMRLLNGTSDFMLIQFGLCTFYWDEDSKEYLNDAYNFYLFPRGRPGPERLFLCQSSSLDFLAAQGFDFNKLIKEGISYMTEPTESRLRENLIERQKLYSNDKDNIKIPEESKQHVEDLCQKVKEFIDEKKSDEMEIDRVNAFIRRLLFQELGKRFKQEVFLETKVLENKNRVLKVTRITSENKGVDREGQKKEKEWEELEEAVGFSKVARMISQSDKLVIGHNMLLDVLHTLSHFFQPLPAEYPSFKEFAHCMFPRLLDTKYMSSLPPFKDKVNSSVLPHLLATLGEPPFKMPQVASKDNRGYIQTDDKSHEAGYDAYVTGLCFLSMHSHLMDLRHDKDRRVVADAPVLKPFLNKLYLAKTAHQDSSFMNLDGTEPTPSRDHVFHLTFPKDWQRNEINQLFSPFGPITVQFLDETSAMIALSRRDQARDVIRILAKSDKTSLTPYAAYKNMLAKQALSNDKTWRRPEEDATATNATQQSTPQKPVPTSSISRNSTKFIPEKVDRSTFEMNTSRTEPKTPNVERQRSNSLSSPARAARKRTSSGMFQIEDVQPPPSKKISLSPEEIRSASGDIRSPQETNGRRRKTSVVPMKDKDNATRKSKRVIERFDNQSSEGKTVSAFQESDSWD